MLASFPLRNLPRSYYNEKFQLSSHCTFIQTLGKDKKTKIGTKENSIRAFDLVLAFQEDMLIHRLACKRPHQLSYCPKHNQHN